MLNFSIEFVKTYSINALVAHYSKIVKEKMICLIHFTFPLTHFPFRAYLFLFSLIFMLFFSGSLFLARLRLCLLSFSFSFFPLLSLNPSCSSLPSTHAAKPISTSLLPLTKPPSQTQSLLFFH